MNKLLAKRNKKRFGGHNQEAILASIAEDRLDRDRAHRELKRKREKYARIQVPDLRPKLMLLLDAGLNSKIFHVSGQIKQYRSSSEQGSAVIFPTNTLDVLAHLMPVILSSARDWQRTKET